MIRALILIAALALMALAVLGLSRPAHAQAAQCAPHDQIVGGLAVNFGQSLHSFAITGTNLLAETFLSASHGSWTFTITGLDGVTCILASGVGFEAVVKVLPKEGVPG